MDSTKFRQNYTPELIATNGVNTNILAGNQLLNNDALETIEPSVFADYEVSLIVEFLITSHEDFRIRRLPEILGTASQLLKNTASTKISHVGDILLSHFAREMKEHFQYEEENLFPYALKCQNGKRPLDYSTEIFEASHPKFIIDTQKLIAFFELHEEDLKTYLSYRILINQLQELERALQTHGEIEDNVLISKLRAIEEI